jgi:predicted transcriptional regulator
VCRPSCGCSRQGTPSSQRCNCVQAAQCMRLACAAVADQTGAMHVTLENQAQPIEQPSLSEQMIQMTSGHVIAQALYVVAELGIADLVASGPRSSTELAQAVGAHAPSLYRILRTLASLGVFVEGEDQTFGLTPLAEALRSDVPGSARAWALVNCGISWRAYGELLYSVRTGQPGFDRAFGMSVFEYTARHPEALAMFGKMLVDFAAEEVGAVASAYSLSDVKSVIDVGGGSGNLLAALVESNPTLRGTVFERPPVAEAAVQWLHAAGLSHRCDVLEGDFFESVPTGGDVYVLSRVIHDWDEAHCLTLLGNCRRAMEPLGRLLIVEIVLPGPNEPSTGRLLDLIMLANAPRGQERTLDEYQDLLARAAFRLTRVVGTASPVSVIEAVPV